jgi:hypothetical protein
MSQQEAGALFAYFVATWVYYCFETKPPPGSYALYRNALDHAFISGAHRVRRTPET